MADYLNLDKSSVLKYYKRSDIQEAIVEAAAEKEVAVSFGGTGYGKRPDVLKYPKDVIELVKSGATSFHCSEELWTNVFRICPEMKRKEMDSLRKGWDLVLDIDCPVLEYSKIAADLLIQAINHHGVKSVSVKFSGNHGFHIAVPFEAFPEKVHDKYTKDLFPEGPRKIAAYLREMIREHLASKILAITDIDVIMKKTGKKFEELVIDNKFDPFRVLEIDTILIASRHLYRMPYSFNEKSGLISIPVSPEHILEFKKAEAVPEKITISDIKFLPRDNIIPNEAKQLIVQAFDFKVQKEEEEKQLVKTEEKDFYEPEMAIPEQYFPPCIKTILKGLDDGRKRSLFVLTNFLTSVGWKYDQIEELLKKWNKRNKEELREVNIVGQIRYHKQHKKKILPPNCDNMNYYKGYRVCHPDNLCHRIKNPVSYTIRKVKFLNQKKGRKKAKTKKQEEKGSKEGSSDDKKQKTSC